LACVRHAASVQSEPGSNSSLELAGPEGPILQRDNLNSQTLLLGVTDVTQVRVTLYWLLPQYRRPHKSPAHTVKDLPRSLSFTLNPFRGSARTSRPGEPHIIDQLSNPSSVLFADLSAWSDPASTGTRSAGRESYVEQGGTASPIVNE